MGVESTRSHSLRCSGDRQASRKTNKFAFHDVGLATENLLLQASSVGLAAHVMGGFHADRAKATFNIPPEFEPVAIIALGYEGGTEFLPQPLARKRIGAQSPEAPFGICVRQYLGRSLYDSRRMNGTNILNRTINN